MGLTRFSKSANGSLPYQAATTAMESDVSALASEAHKGINLCTQQPTAPSRATVIVN